MLDDKTLEWLERRKNICTHCCKRKDCRIGKRHNYSTTKCPYWGLLAPGSTYGYVFEDYRDAAEFEARVAEYLAHGSSYPISECTLEQDIEKGLSDCTKFTEHGIKCADCRLKSIRIAVEREMIAEGKGPGRKE